MLKKKAERDFYFLTKYSQGEWESFLLFFLFFFLVE